MRLPERRGTETPDDPRATDEVRLALRRVGGTWQVVLDPGANELRLGGLDELIARLRAIASGERRTPRGLR